MISLHKINNRIAKYSLTTNVIYVYNINSMNNKDSMNNNGIIYINSTNNTFINNTNSMNNNGVISINNTNNIFINNTNSMNNNGVISINNTNNIFINNTNSMNNNRVISINNTNRTNSKLIKKNNNKDKNIIDIANEDIVIGFIRTEKKTEYNEDKHFKNLSQLCKYFHNTSLYPVNNGLEKFLDDFNSEDLSFKDKETKIENVNFFKLIVLDNNAFNKLDYIQDNSQCIQTVICIKKNEYLVYLKNKYIMESNNIKIRIPQNTSIANMNDMLFRCKNLKSLDLSNIDITKLDIKNVKNTIFNDCINLEELNMSNIKGDLINFFIIVKNSLKMLKNLDISNTYTNKSNLDNLFEDYKNLEILNMNNITYKNDIKSACNMFKGCVNLKNLNMSYIKFMSIEDITYDIFSDCKSLEELNLSNAKIDIVIFLMIFKKSLQNLTKIDISNTYTYRYSLEKIFCDYINLKNINFDKFKIIKINKSYRLEELNKPIIKFSKMFENCTSLKIIDFSNCYFTKIKRMSNFIKNCISLETLNLSNIDISELKYDNCGIGGTCYNLKNLNLSNIKGDAIYFFYYNILCFYNLQTLNISNTTTYIYDLGYTFQDLRNLESLDISNLSFPNNCITSEMFYECENLQYLNITSTYLTEDMLYSIINDCYSLKLENIKADEKNKKSLEQSYKKNNKY